jgi:hypothetical protein
MSIQKCLARMPLEGRGGQDDNVVQDGKRMRDVGILALAMHCRLCDVLYTESGFKGG